MGITFNADEILQMAEQIERNGQKFYRKAAKQAGDAETKKMFNHLADWEAEHEAIFTEMRKELSAGEAEPVVFDPDGEAAMYLMAMADGHVFNVGADASEKLTGKESRVEVFRLAIEIEKDSIAFYLGLKELVGPQTGREKVEKIIKEEMRHLAILDQQRRA